MASYALDPFDDTSTLAVPPAVRPKKIVPRAGVPLAPNLAVPAASDPAPTDPGTASIAQPPLGRRAAEALYSGVNTALDVNAGVNRIVSAPGRAVVGAVGDAANAAGQFGKDFFNLPDAPAATPASIAMSPKAAPAVAAPAAPVAQPGPLLGAQSGTITTPPAAVSAAPAVTAPAMIARIAQPPAIVAPVKAPLGPLPTLDESPNQNIFSAMGKLSRDQAAYRDKAGLNAQAQGNFNNASKAYMDNLKAMSDTAQANAGIGTENRANLAQPPAIEHQKAQTELYKQQTETAKQVEADRIKTSDLRQKLSTETDPGKRRQLENQLYAIQGKPQPKYQIVTEKGVAADGITPTQTSHIVTEDTNGNPIATPLVGPGVGGTKTQAPQAAIDHLKKNPAMKDAFKQKYGYLPAGA
jgi:hypothetical protein